MQYTQPLAKDKAGTRSLYRRRKRKDSLRRQTRSQEDPQMELQYLIAQMVGFIAMALIILSFQCKGSRKLFFVQLCGNAVYMVHFVLLGAYSGGAALLVSCLRNLVYSSGRPWAAWRGWPWVIVGCNLLVSVLTWKDLFSIFPLIVGVTLAVSGWSRNGKTIRLANLFVISPCWLIYDFYSGSLAGALTDSISMISVIVSVVRYGWKALDTEDRPEPQKKEEVNV